jgi:hypothetical protein
MCEGHTASGGQPVAGERHVGPVGGGGDGYDREQAILDNPIVSVLVAAAAA